MKSHCLEDYNAFLAVDKAMVEHMSVPNKNKKVEHIGAGHGHGDVAVVTFMNFVDLKILCSPSSYHTGSRLILV